MKKKTFYVTTPIYYPSGKPHVGTVYTDIVADVFARWHRMQGEDVFFTTGTDEHAQKVEKAAKEEGISPKVYVDKMVVPFMEAFQKYTISYDKFVRTTDESHKKYCQGLLKKLYVHGDIYKGKYEGWYCISCETYYTEKDLNQGNCPLHGTKATWMEEEAYFFKMSKYQKKVGQYIKKNDYIFPKEKQQFLLSRMNKGLKDLCISRTNTEWGIQFPFDTKFRGWVWVDALPNYISSTATPKTKKFWPADLHITAHDIIWHHSVIWLSMLLAAGEKLPKKLLVHGFIQGEGGLKMSKSLGNVVDPLEVIKEYPVDSVRYFLLREIPLGSDGAFSMKALQERHNNELVNELANLQARTLSMIEKYYQGKIPHVAKNELPKKLALKKINKAMEKYELHMALSEIWKFIAECNKYISDNEPWELAKTKNKRLDVVLYNVADSLRMISILIDPFLPHTAEKLQHSLGMKKKENFKDLEFGKLGNNTIQKTEYLFTRKEEKKDMAQPIEKKQEKEHSLKEPIRTAQASIPFSEWERMQFKIGTIRKAEPHPNADKLYVLQVDVGEEKPRQIVAGIRQHYTVEELVGKQITVFTNLQPAVIRGIESHGMLLAAKSDGKLIVLSPEKVAKAGSPVG